MDERMRFVARLMEGEKMAVLCREFDISRKTGYKLFNRYKHSGLESFVRAAREQSKAVASSKRAKSDQGFINAISDHAAE
jgi:transposase